jgi:PAS domain S-box-containing protein
VHKNQLMAAHLWWRTEIVSKAWRYGLAVISCAVALAVALPTDAAASSFAIAVLVSSLYGGRGPAILSVVLSALSFDYFFLPPLHHFTVALTSSPRFAVFLVAIVLIAALMEAKRRADESRWQIDAQYRVIADTSRDAILSIDDTGRIFFLNPAAVTAFGWAASDLIGRPLTVVIPDFRLAAHATRAELTGRRKDGTEFPVEVSFGEVANGRQRTFTGFIRDISVRKRAEAALQKSESYLAEAQKLSRTGSFGWNTSTGEIFWTLETFRVFGVDPGVTPSLEIIFDRIHPGDRAEVSDFLDRARQSGADLDFEHRLLMPDGSVKHLHVLARAAGESGAVEYIGAAMDITSRKETEEHLRANELSLRLMVDSIPAWVSTMRPDGEAESVNRQARDYTGKTSEEMKNWLPTVHPDDQVNTADCWRRAVETRGPYNVEARVQRADGAYRWFHARGLPLGDGEGNVVRWYVVLTDIEDRKRVEEALRASELNFRLMVHCIPSLLVTSTAAGEIELVNQTLINYTGKSLEELRNWPVVVHPGDLPAVASLWARSVETGHPFEVDARVRRADGVYRWFHCRGLPLRDNDGGIIRWYTLLTDIEDRIKAEDALRTSERELGLIIETIPALVWSAGPGGEVNYMNRRVVNYTGATLEILARDGWTNFLHPDDFEPTLRVWSHAVATGGEYEVQYRLRRSDGAYRWFQAVGQLLRDGEGRVTRWYGLLIDIDDRKRMEEDLRATQSRLSRATQTATVGELAASIAHEINQPLAAVVANGHACLRWLTAEPPSLPKAREAAERIVRDGKEAGEVVRRIRALFRRAALEKVALDLNDVIGEVLRLLGGETTKRRVSVETDLETTLPPVVADRIQLQQLVLNLLINGLDAMDEVADRPRKLSIRSTRHCEDTALVEIGDSGVGLKDPDKVFEAFFTTKANGMGMGLTICRSIVEAHEGRLWASSAEGPGTIFHFTLPLNSSVTA